MPTYDYRCERTGEVFEIWQSFRDDALTTCPRTHDGETDECGAPVKKVFSKVGIAFKGDGFYKTDHGSLAGAAKKESSSDGGSSSSESSSGSSSSGSSSGGSDSSSTSSSSSAASSGD